LVHQVMQDLMLVMLMKGRKRLDDLVMIQQFGRNPGIFSQNEIHIF